MYFNKPKKCKSTFQAIEQPESFASLTYTTTPFPPHPQKPFACQIQADLGREKAVWSPRSCVTEWAPTSHPALECKIKRFLRLKPRLQEPERQIPRYLERIHLGEPGALLP